MNQTETRIFAGSKRTLKDSDEFGFFKFSMALMECTFKRTERILLYVLVSNGIIDDAFQKLNILNCGVMSYLFFYLQEQLKPNDKLLIEFFKVHVLPVMFFLQVGFELLS